MTCEVDAVQRLMIGRKAIADQGGAVYHAVHPSERLPRAFLVDDVAHNCLREFLFFVAWTHVQVSAPRIILLTDKVDMTKRTPYN